MDLNIEFLASHNWDGTMLEKLKWLRENDPVHWSEKDDLWVLTKYGDVSSVSKNQELFTSAFGVRPDNPARIGLIDEPEPRHTHLRRMINRGFTPRMVKKLEKVFLEIVTDAIDSVAARGHCDFVDEIAVPLPLLLIAEMIGIHKKDQERFHDWSDRMIAADGNTAEPEIMAAAGQAFLEYSTYLDAVIEDRRKTPRDDLISILVGAESDGLLQDMGVSELPSEALNDEHLELCNNELIMLCVILLVAGNETTRNGITGGMQLLMDHPDQRQKLIDDPSLIPAAVEEMVRLVAPVRSFSRTATRDTDLRGHKIEKGQRVLLMYPSANRDADVYDDPEAFQVDRNPQHLGFGVGSHFCLGANLARMEMRVAFEELLRRLPDMEYAAAPEFKPSALVRSCMHMQVRFTPEQ